MDNTLVAISDFFSRAPKRLLRAKWLILLAILLISVFMMAGIVKQTSFDMSMEGFLNQEDPAIKALNNFREQFGSDDSVYLVYRAKDGDAFSEASLTAIQQLTDDLENWQQLNPADYQVQGQPLESFKNLDHIRRVQSIANVRIQTSDDDTLRSDRLVSRNLPDSSDGISAIKSNAMTQEDFKLAFYSGDGEYGALMIQTDFGTQVAEDFEVAVDAADIILDDSFSDFSAGDDFSIGFDEAAEVQEIDFIEPDMLIYVDFYSELRAIFDKYDDAFEFYPVGNAPMMEFFWRTQIQMMLLGVGMVLIFILLLWLLFRSGSAVFWPIITIALSIVWVWGGTVWLGVQISQMISLTIMLTFAVGIADCVHVMSAYMSNRRNGLEHDESLAKAYGKTGLALLVTSITTMSGLLALSFSGLALVKVFAVMSAMGVAMAFLFTIILLPVLLDIWHPGKAKSEKGYMEKIAAWWHSLSATKKWTIGITYFAVVLGLFAAINEIAVGVFISLVSLAAFIVNNWQTQILNAVPGIAQRNSWLILSMFAVLFGVCSYGMLHIKIDTNISELFYEDSEIRLAYNAVDTNMAGAQSLEVMIDTGEADGLLYPPLLQAMEALQIQIETEHSDQVSRTFSLANVVKDTNRVMNNDDPAFETIPDSQAMVSQLLYLFNSANPDDRRSVVSDDYSRAHITVNAYNAGSYEYKQFVEDINADIEHMFADIKSERFPELDIRVTGSIAVMMRAVDELASTQYSSFMLALGVISVILIFSLGSLQGGLIAMIPNLLPALVTFGLLGLLGISLDTDTLLIAPLVIGIAVDDTIHFMTHYRVSLIKTGSMSKALASTIKDVGQAVMFTSMVLGLGFGLLSFCDYLGLAKVGFFGAIAIFLALLCDLFFLPAIIMIFKPKFGLKNLDQKFHFRGETA